MPSTRGVNPNASNAVKAKRMARVRQQMIEEQPHPDCLLCKRGVGGNHRMIHRQLIAKAKDVSSL